MHDVSNYLDNPIELFRQLKIFWRNDHKDKTETTKQLILNLNHTKKIDFCAYGVIALGNGLRPHEVFFILKDSFPFLSLNTASTIEYFKTIFEKFENDSFSGFQYEPVAKLTKEQPDFAKQLLTDLIEIDESFVTGYISAILANVPNLTVNELYEEITDLIFHPKDSVAKAAIFAIGKLKFVLEKHKGLIEETFQNFDKLLETKSLEIDHAITCSICEMCYLGEAAKSRILKLSRRAEPMINFQISSFLCLQYSSYINEKWFEELVMSFSSTSCKYGGIIQNLDSFFMGILKIEQQKDLFENFFLEWFQKSDFNQEYEFASLFSMTASELVKKIPLFENMITKYLVSKNILLNWVAVQLVRYSNLYEKRTVSLDQDLLKALSDNEIEILTHRILGFFFEVKTLCSLVFSILKTRNEENMKPLYFFSFVDFIGFDFPQQTIQFLKEKLSEFNQIATLQAILNEILCGLENQEKEMNSLPRLEELCVSNQHSYQIDLEESKNMNVAMEKASKNSLASIIGHRIPLKYGRGCFHYYEDEYTEPTSLTSFSQILELPKTEFFQPLNATIKRVEFRTCGRANK